ncbi:16441_t:CDS:10, partial [Dentiscutata erythropus]
IFGVNPFEESVEKATSELVPKGQDNLALNLDISDQIRSKSVQPKEALRILKKRITHENPNVQLLALSLTDTCVKNGGHHFLIEVASRDFVDTLVSIIKSNNSNHEVIQKILGLIQTWGLTFEDRPGLTYVTDTYKLLKHEGCIFPKVDKAAAVMIDTATPPEWTDSDDCERCRAQFTMINRKHHCRNCGKTFCGECSSKTTTLPHIGINEPVRVCDTCYMNKQFKTRSINPADFKPYSNPTPTQPTLYSNSILPVVNGNHNTSSSQNIDNEDDEDIKKAIELSLKEAEFNKNYVQPVLQKSAKKIEPAKQEEEDIAAAIVASLQDVHISRTPNSLAYNVIDYSPYKTSMYELSPIEEENIYSFSEALERIRQSGGDLMRDRQVQELHEQVVELKTKLTKSLTETIQKHQDLVDMHEKLSQAVKLYDRLLDERFSNSYARRASSISYSIPQRVTSSGVPSVGNVYPSIASPNQSSSIYPNVPSYPIASAPATSPSYFAAQTVQYTQPQSRTIESGTQQTVVPLQQASQQPSYAYTATQTSYTSAPIPTLNDTTSGEHNSLSGTVHQG